MTAPIYLPHCLNDLEQTPCNPCIPWNTLCKHLTPNTIHQHQVHSYYSVATVVSFVSVKRGSGVQSDFSYHMGGVTVRSESSHQIAKLYAVRTSCKLQCVRKTSSSTAWVNNACIGMLYSWLSRVHHFQSWHGNEQIWMFVIWNYYVQVSWHTCVVLQFIIPNIGTRGEEGGVVRRANRMGGRKGGGGGELLATAVAVALVAMIIGIGVWYKVHQIWFLCEVTIISLCIYYTCSFSFT